MSDPQQPLPMAPRSWRLPLIAFAVAIMPLVVGFGWYFFRVANPDPMMKTVLVTVAHDAKAQALLGTGIAMSGLPTFNYCHDKFGEIARYTFSVRGKRGEADGKAAVLKDKQSARIKSLTLTAPDGTVSDIVGTAADEAWLEPQHKDDDTCKHKSEGDAS